VRSVSYEENGVLRIRSLKNYFKDDFKAVVVDLVVVDDEAVVPVVVVAGLVVVDVPLVVVVFVVVEVRG